MSYQKVAVTGAAGFIGSHVVADLLRAGYVVHATVRPGAVEGGQVEHLRVIEKSLSSSSLSTRSPSNLPTAPPRLHVFEADLMTDGSFDEAFGGVDAVIHVASPLTMYSANPQRDVIEPAVFGTRNVLRSATRAGSVRKVVVTSSFSAMHCHRPEHVLADGSDGRIHTEVDWNDTATPSFLPYSYSKDAAERAAWEFVGGAPLENGGASNGNHEQTVSGEESGTVPFKLVTINPTIVIGPALSGERMSGSVAGLVDIIEGRFLGVLDMTLAFVDVRDVSAAHVRALESDTAHGRYLCVAQNGRPMHMRDAVAVMRRFGFQTPQHDLTAPWLTHLLKLATHLVPGQMGQFVRRELGVDIAMSNQKIRRDLDITFRPVEKSLRDTFEDIIKWGFVKDPRRSWPSGTARAANGSYVDENGSQSDK